MPMSVLSLCVLSASCVYSTHKGQKRASDSPGTPVTNSCERLCGGWALNPCPRQLQEVLLTLSHLNSPRKGIFKKIIFIDFFVCGGCGGGEGCLFTMGHT